MGRIKDDPISAVSYMHQIFPSTSSQLLLETQEKKRLALYRRIQKVHFYPGNTIHLNTYRKPQAAYYFKGWWELHLKVKNSLPSFCSISLQRNGRCGSCGVLEQAGPVKVPTDAASKNIDTDLLKCWAGTKRNPEPDSEEEYARSWMIIYIEEVTARWYSSSDSQQSPCIPFLCSISGCQEAQLQLLEADMC